MDPAFSDHGKPYPIAQDSMNAGYAMNPYANKMPGDSQLPTRAGDTSWVDDFHRDGFVVIDKLFDAPEVDSLRTAVETSEIRSELHAQGAERHAVHLLGLTGMHARFLDLARDPRILDRVEALLGPDIQLQHSKLATKPAAMGLGAYPWHQDFAFFPHTNTNLVAVMVMLDDATPENGCLQAVRGSHELGLLEHRMNGAFSGCCQESGRWSDPHLVVPLMPRAGGISIHHALTLHGSDANRTDRPRRGLVFQYRADDAYQLADTVFDDTGLLVRGTRRGVVRCDAGRWLLPVIPEREPAFGSAWHQAGAHARRCNPPVMQPISMP